MDDNHIIIISAPDVPDDKMQNLVLAIRNAKIDMPMYVTKMPMKPITKEDIMELHEHLDYIVKSNGWKK